MVLAVPVFATSKVVETIRSRIYRTKAGGDLSLLRWGGGDARTSESGAQDCVATEEAQKKTRPWRLLQEECSDTALRGSRSDAPLCCEEWRTACQDGSRASPMGSASSPSTHHNAAQALYAHLVQVLLHVTAASKGVKIDEEREEAVDKVLLPLSASHLELSHCFDSFDRILKTQDGCLMSVVKDCRDLVALGCAVRVQELDALPAR